MIILFGMLFIGIVLGSVHLGFALVDKINDKFNKNFDYEPFIFSILILECLIVLQILINFIK